MLRLGINMMVPCLVMWGCYYLFNWILSYFNPFKYILVDLLQIKKLVTQQWICLCFFAGLIYFLKVTQLCPTKAITDYLFVDLSFGIFFMIGFTVNQNLINRIKIKED